MDLAVRLRALRGEMLQRDLAEAVGVSSALISSWESGAAIPPRGRIRAYAKVFGGGDGRSIVLLEEELMLLRSVAEPRERTNTGTAVHPTSTPMLDVLKDIRWLLQEIRDRLPPPG